MTFLETHDNRKHQWSTDREETLIELHARGLSASRIGAEMGATRNSIIGKLNRMGKSTHEAPDLWTDAETDCLKSSWATGITVKEVAASILKQCGSIKSTRSISAKADRLHLTKRMTTKRVLSSGMKVIIDWQPRVMKADFTPLNIPFMALASNDCREVTGQGTDGLALYCGHQIHDRSFCETHFRMNYWIPNPHQRKF